ncbi:MAG: hypothetical protein L0H93_19170 [Nocardioides sp.]|nr:hypothetical protein [Nocardioides sp.]
MRIEFHGSARPTLGVEWEFALVDRSSRDLINSAAALFTSVDSVVRELRDSL